VKTGRVSGLLANSHKLSSFLQEMIKMAGFGRFKLTDALPEQTLEIEDSPTPGGVQQGSPTGRGKGRSKVKNKSASAKGKPVVGSELAAEQLREARETSQAKNAEGSIRDRMVDIGRGNQQAGRQRAK
jgi:hypothetical protein